MSLVMPVTGEVEITRNVQVVRGSTSSCTESQFTSKMYLYGREICFLLAIIFTSYAALHNSNPKVSKSPAAMPFFSRTTLLTDFYRGQLGPAFEKISESDVSFVMYYAPWDADSQNLRADFKAVAQYYQKEVYFAAINCWHPMSECRQQFSRIQMFPVLIAYTQQAKGVHYKGVKDADHMIAFLAAVMRPLERVASPTDLAKLMTTYDAVAVGFFHFHGNVGGVGFHQFYSSSLEYLETDPQREVGFAVVTDETTAGVLGVYDAPTIRLYLWNETLEYRGEDGTGVARWVSDNAHQAALWVAPPGVKSLMLAPYLEDGATLILFTPRYPLHRSQPLYQLLREIALEYYNCDNNPWISELTRQLAMLRAENRQTYWASVRSCQNQPSRGGVISVSTVVADRWTNLSCSRAAPPDPDACAAACSSDVDIRSAPALTAAAREEACRRLARAATHAPIFPVLDDAGSVAGLACRTNRTLSMLAMDSRKYGHFAVALGARLGETSLVIVDAHDESSFVEAGVPSPGSLRAFIGRYTSGVARRNLRSAGPAQSPATCAVSGDEVCVQEVTSETFKQVIMDQTKNVVVLFHSPYCAFCGAVSHAFLSAARQLRAVNSLAFVRLDGESNDLAWEFTVHRYPTVMYLPAARKSESRVFPQQLAVTARNLVRFVLANLGGGCEVAVSLCSTQGAECVARARAACLREVAQALAHYRSMVVQWRAAQQASPRQAQKHQESFTRQTRQLLFRLQHLHEVQTVLNTAVTLEAGSKELSAIQRSFSLYRSSGLETSSTDTTVS